MGHFYADLCPRASLIVRSLILPHPLLSITGNSTSVGGLNGLFKQSDFCLRKKIEVTCQFPSGESPIILQAEANK